ncbi:unnamed protein product [Schistocephalus solidus]|uniref:Ig-like domain-containing protein n=1 Tax=Schistocephalus solidus TaxID=70667 RepID=A0A183SHK9_SCHSO|nr:unnamed protein product [Schistocephalus solidus]
MTRIEGLSYQWKLQRKDGIPVDTASLAEQLEISEQPSESTLRLGGLRDTASGLQVQCIATNRTAVEDGRPGPVKASELLYSQPVFFDIKPTEKPDKEPMFDGVSELSVVSEDDSTRKYTVIVGGLDQNGKLSAKKGSTIILEAKLIDQKTGEEVPSEDAARRIFFGIETQYADGSPAPTNALAENIQVDSLKGKITLKGYRGDTNEAKKDDLRFRVIAELVTLSPDDEAPDDRLPPDQLPKSSRQRFASPFITVETLAEDGTSPEGADENKDDLLYGWEVSLRNGQRVPMTGILAESVQESGKTLRIRNLREQSAALFGRCVVARKAGNSARYYSRYFAIGPKCEDSGPFKVDVHEVPTGDAGTRMFRCNPRTGTQLNNSSHYWQFVSSSGETVLPGHLFESVEIAGDSIVLGRLRGDLDLSKLADREGPIDGQCIVLTGGDDPTKSASDGFIRIDASKEDPKKPTLVGAAEVEGKLYDALNNRVCFNAQRRYCFILSSGPEKIHDGSFHVTQNEKPEAAVKGPVNGIVSLGESESTTLKCEGIDGYAGTVMSGLAIEWEIRTHDNRPIDTSAVADKVEILPDGSLRLTGLRDTATGTRARCVLMNATTPVSGDDIGPKEGGILPQGKSRPGKFIDFDIKPLEEPEKKPNFTGVADLLTSPDDKLGNRYKVIIDGFYDSHELKGAQGETIDLRVKLVSLGHRFYLLSDAVTGEDLETQPENVRFGLEVTHSDGSPAPLSTLADSVIINAATGNIKLDGFQGDLQNSQKGDLRFRVVAEITEPRRETPGRIREPTRERIASAFYTVSVTNPDGTPIKDEREPTRIYETLHPMVSGLSDCGSLPAKGEPQVTLQCKVQSSTMKEEDLVFGWELRLASGQQMPMTGVVADTVSQSGSSITFTGLNRPDVRAFGRCVVSPKADSSTKYYSPYFEIGTDCKPDKGSKVTVKVHELPQLSPDERKFMCRANDAMSNQQLQDAKFQWTFTTASGDMVMPSFLFERIAMNGNTIIMTGIRKDLELSKLLPDEGPLMGKCIAVFPSRTDPSVTQAVASDPFIAIDTRREQPPAILEELPKEDKKPKVNIGGVDDGKVMADEGDTVILTCDVQATRKAMNGVVYQWVIERKDGKPVDTSVLARQVQFMPGPGGSILRLTGLRDTASGIQARCVVTSASSGINKVPTEIPAGPLAPNERLVGEPVEFDIQPSTAEDKEPDFDALPELDLVHVKDPRRKYTVVIDGLDESGQLSAPRGSNVSLQGQLIDPETGEEVKDDDATGKTLFGVEVQYADGRPAPISSLAEHVQMNAETGELKLKGYRGDALTTESDNLKLRVIAERMSWSPEVIEKEEEKPKISTLRKPSRQRFASPFVTVGLSTEEDGSSVNGYVTAEDEVVFGWEVIRPDGKPVPITGNVATSLEVVGNKLYLQRLLPVKERMFGRCVVARRAGNKAIYSSDFFEIGPDCESNLETGEPVSADSNFLWEFRTTSGDVVLPNHLFGTVSASGDTIELSRLRSDIDLPAYLPDGEVIEGRCVHQSKSGNETEVPSDPFIFIGPSSKEDPRKPKVPEITDGSEADYDKPTVKVTGAPDKIVVAEEGQAVTLTCQATDPVTNLPINGLTYEWEIRLADNSPIDTGALAEKVETVPGPNGEELRLEGLRETANGLRARCILMNATALVDMMPDVPGGDKGVLRPGDRQAGEFIDFNVKPTPKPSEKPEFSTIKDLVPAPAEDPNNYFKVVVEGLDETNNLVANKGSNVILQGRLVDAQTGEDVTSSWDGPIFGLETSYADGRPAPVSMLADRTIVDAKTGEIKLQGYMGDLLNPDRRDLRARIVAERTILTQADSPDKVSKPTRQRIASPYFFLYARDEDGNQIADSRPVAPEYWPIKPTVRGLSPCGNLPFEEGSSATLHCLVEGEAEIQNDFLYGWEIISSYGKPVPLVGVAKLARQEGSTLELTNLQKLPMRVFGRCLVGRKSGGSARYPSNYFEFGAAITPVPPFEPKTPATSKSEITPITAKTTTPGPVPSTPSPVTSVPGPVSPTPGPVTPVTGVEHRRIKIRLTGVDRNRVVKGKPGSNATLTCEATDDNTNEPIPDASIIWEFTDTDQNTISPMQIAHEVTIAGNNRITFVDLRPDPKAGGRCTVTIAGKTMLSSPFFVFHVTDRDDEAPPTSGFPDGPEQISVNVVGLDENNQLTVKQIGDDATLQCQAVQVSTGNVLSAGEDVRYGWEWRYLDGDATSTSNLAVGVEASGSRFGLRGVQAPTGTVGGRSVKGRCVVHVSAAKLEPESSLDQTEVFKFTSEYFTVDVERKLHRPLLERVPVEGKSEDNILVITEGVDGDRFEAEQDSDANFKCVALNATNKEPITSPGKGPTYSVCYGWEFQDASGRAVDSSYFAQSINAQTSGELRLAGLTAPTSGRFPMRIRCLAVVEYPRDPTAPSKLLQAPQIYKSDFFALYIRRPDGTVTGPRPGEIDPDISGKRVTVEVKDLHPDGSLRLQPGENAELQCVATETETGQPLAEDEVIFDWSFQKPSGLPLSKGEVARSVVASGSRLAIQHAQLLGNELDGSQARCEVMRNGQLYTSPYFPLHFKPKGNADDLEGDGRIKVRVEGVDPQTQSLWVTPGETKQFKCIATDSANGKNVEEVSYAWDYRGSRGTNLPYIQDVTDDARFQSLREEANGVLSITGSSKSRVDPQMQTSIRCRVTKDGVVYSSPYYDVRRTDEEGRIPEEPIPLPHPRLWVKVTGLDKNNSLVATAGETVELKCSAHDTKTGEELQNIDCRWELRRPNGDFLDIAQLATGEVKLDGNSMKMVGVKPIEATGRCVLVDPQNKDEFFSPYFRLRVKQDPSAVDGEEPDVSGVTETVEDTDTRVKVSVSGVDSEGNLVGMVGHDASLQCNAEAVSEDVQILSLDWEFVDAHGARVSPNAVAESVRIPSPTDGNLELSGLKANSKRGEYRALSGRCIAIASVSEPTGDGEQAMIKRLKYPSKYFAVIVRDVKEPRLPLLPEDRQGTHMEVIVTGLDASGVLTAQPGDVAELTCEAVDSRTRVPEPDVDVAWQISDATGRKINPHDIAQDIERTENRLKLNYLRPTTGRSASEALYGQCVVFSPEKLRFYKSVPFKIRVGAEADFPPLITTGESLSSKGHYAKDKYVVEVTGDVKNGVFSAAVGGTAELVCSAKDKTTMEPVPEDKVTYRWVFEQHNREVTLSSLGGDLGASVSQTQLAEGTATRLKIAGLNKATWTGTRCSARIKMDDGVEKTYFSQLIKTLPTGEDGGPSEPLDQVDTEGIRTRTVPDVVIKIQGMNESNVVEVAAGSDKTLICAAINKTTGQPVRGIQYTWDIRTTDDEPLSSNLLAKTVQTDADGQHLLLSDIQPSSDSAKVRCLARPLMLDEITDKPQRFFASPFGRFKMQAAEDSTPPIESLIDIKTGVPLDEGLSFGWKLSTGPDNQAVELSRLAEKVVFDGPVLNLINLRKSKESLGGFRGQCLVSPTSHLVPLEQRSQLQDPTIPVLASDVFAIHIRSRPSPDEDLPEPRPIDEPKLPLIWTPGSIAKDAVYLRIIGLNDEDKFVANPGDNASIECVAYESVSMEQMKVGNQVVPRFGWQLRDAITKEALAFSEIAAGRVSIVQTTPEHGSSDGDAASRLKLERIRAVSGDRKLQGRCTVRVGEQVYRSPYFGVEITSTSTGPETLEPEPGYWATDNNVKVLLFGLGEDNIKEAAAGSDVSMSCKAYDAETDTPLPNNLVSYGWHLMDENGMTLAVSPASRVSTDGEGLVLQGLVFPEKEGLHQPIYGWCSVETKRRATEINRYRSKIFTIKPSGDALTPGGEPEVGKVKPEVFIRVERVDGGKDFALQAGETIELIAKAVDPESGRALPEEQTEFGWEWRDQADSPVHMTEFASSEETAGPLYTLRDVNLIMPVKGRAVLTYRPLLTVEGEQPRKWVYSSPFIHLTRVPKAEPDKQEAREEEGAVAEAKDNDILIEVSGLNDEGQLVTAEGSNAEIKAQAIAKDNDILIEVSGLNDKGQLVTAEGSNAEIKAQAIDAQSRVPLSADSDPVIKSFGWELLDANGMPTHSGMIAESITMYPSNGSLQLNNIKTSDPDRHLLIRMTAVVDRKQEEGMDKEYPKRYKSEAIPFVVSPDAGATGTWPGETKMDVTQKAIKVRVEGLTETGELLVDPQEDVELRAIAEDEAGVQVPVASNGFVWRFVDRKNRPLPLGLIAESTEVSDNGKLILNRVRDGALSEPARGSVRVAVEREGGKPQYYSSHEFNFKRRSPKTEGEKVTPEPTVTEAPTLPPDDKPSAEAYGFQLKLESSTSSVYPGLDGDVILARPSQPFELKCTAEFEAGHELRTSDTGEPVPNLVWFYRRPEIPGDVPIPAELYRLSPPHLETLAISEMDGNSIKISSEHYDFRDDNAEFQCHAYDGEKPIAMKTGYIHRVKERFKVQVFDETSGTAIYALEKEKRELICYVHDAEDGNLVEPQGYLWEVNYPGVGWTSEFRPGDIAAEVTGHSSKQLILNGLLLPSTDPSPTAVSYALRCVAKYNATYAITSRVFPVNVHRRPTLTEIKLFREKPTQEHLVGAPAEDSYDATQDYAVSCRPEYTAGDVDVTWEKCEDEECTSVSPISPSSDQLLFIADSTSFENEGKYRCYVSLTLRDYNYELVKTAELNLKRMAKPAIYSSEQKVVTLDDELMLQCTDRSSSPEAEVTWSFKPRGTAPPENMDPFRLGSTFVHQRTYVFVIPRGKLLLEHSGTYSCSATNVHGSSTSEIEVSVVEDSADVVKTSPFCLNLRAPFK